jgi:hypothetical protein
MNDVEHQPAQANRPADSSPKGKIRRTDGVPRWVKVFVIVVMSFFGGHHSPGRHLSSAEFDAPVVHSAGATSFFSADEASALSVC